jgi:hypothetical protein
MDRRTSFEILLSALKANPPENIQLL